MPAKQNIYGFDTANWREVLVDGSGRLIVVTAPGVGFESHVYGYDGANWQTLLIESAAQKNLRVALYKGGSEANIGAGSAAFGYGNIGLQTFAALYADDGANLSRVGMLLAGADAVLNTLNTLGAASMLYGFNGATWDRLRTHAGGVLKVEKAAISATLVRKTVVGSVVAGAHVLHQICINPSAANAVVEFTDAIIAAQPIVWDMFFASRETHHFIFDPPIPFTDGIYLETLTGITSIMLCYV